MDTRATVKVVGQNGQISLGKEFAGRQVLVEEREPGVWLIRTAKVIPENERHDMVSAYYRRLTGKDEEEKVAAARAWSIWEGSTSKLFFDPESLERFADPQFALAFARIECHYFMNNCFFPTENFLIENIGKIRHIPGAIVQGRYDVVCPMTSAWDLHRAWPEAHLHITPDAGHSVLEPGNLSALIEATDRFRK